MKIDEYVEKNCQKVLEHSWKWYVIFTIGSFVLSATLTQLFKIQNDVFKILLSVVISTVSPSYGTNLLYKSQCKKYKEKKWKEKFPKDDLSGEWSDVSRYIGYIDANGRTYEREDNVKPAQAIIEQTYNTIKIRNSDGDSFNWHSISASYDGNGNLEILYQVDYYNKATSEGYPSSSIGYETMNVVERTSEGKPTKMKGKFWHCVKDNGEKSYWGEVEYRRKV